MVEISGYTPGERRAFWHTVSVVRGSRAGQLVGDLSFDPSPEEMDCARQFLAARRSQADALCAFAGHFRFRSVEARAACEPLAVAVRRASRARRAVAHV